MERSKPRTRRRAVYTSWRRGWLPHSGQKTCKDGYILSGFGEIPPNLPPIVN